MGILFYRLAVKRAEINRRHLMAECGVALHARYRKNVKELEELQRSQEDVAKRAGSLSQEIFRLREQLYQETGKRAAKLQAMQAARLASEPALSQLAVSSDSDYHVNNMVNDDVAMSEAQAMQSSVSSHVDGTPSTVGMVAASSRAARRARLVLGVCLPRFLEAQAVLDFAVQLHKRTCVFADVVVVGSEEMSDKLDGAESFERALLGDSKRVRESYEDAQETQLFTAEDGRRAVDGHVTHDAAESIAKWGDVLCIAPLCSKYVGRLVSSTDEDLLSELAQVWGYTKHADAYLPTKPFIVAPRVNPMAKHHPGLEQQLCRALGFGCGLGLA